MTSRCCCTRSHAYPDESVSGQRAQTKPPCNQCHRNTKPSQTKTDISLPNPDPYLRFRYKYTGAWMGDAESLRHASCNTIINTPGGCNKFQVSSPPGQPHETGDAQTATGAACDFLMSAYRKTQGPSTSQLPPKFRQTTCTD